MNKLYSYCMPLIVGAFGSLTMGCLPAGDTNITRFDTANYSPDTDGSGLSGTWILTFNNDYVEPDFSAHYQRQLVRLAAVAGAADTYELTNCNAGPTIVRSTVVAASNTIQLSIDGISYEYSATADGRMAAPIYYGNGNLWGTWRAVRLSSNPQFDVGTVGLDFSGDDTGTVKHPTACFTETLDTAPGYPELDSYELSLAGEGDSGIVTALLTQLNGATWLIGTDYAERYLAGPLLADINTLKSTVTGIRGSAITKGDAPDPTTAGVLTVNVKL